MKKFSIITLSVTFILSLTLSTKADWVGDYNGGVNPIKTGTYGDSSKPRSDQVIALFNGFFGTEYNNTSDLLDARGVDPNTSWTANEATIIGAYNNEADFDHHLRVYNGNDEIGYTTSINNVDMQSFPENIVFGSGTDVSFELGAYWGKVNGTPPTDYTFSSGERHGKDDQFHMLAFDVTDLYNALWEDDELYSDVYMFAWEDQYKNADYDYNDLIVFMTNIEANSGGESTPEPATMAVLGLGLAGLGLVARRRRK